MTEGAGNVSVLKGAAGRNSGFFRKEAKMGDRVLLKVHKDEITVSETIRTLMEDYAARGYQVERLSSRSFKIILVGGWVHIFWQDDRIWQEVVEAEGVEEPSSSGQKESDGDKEEPETKMSVFKYQPPVLLRMEGYYCILLPDGSACPILNRLANPNYIHKGKRVFLTEGQQEEMRRFSRDMGKRKEKQDEII